MLTLRFFGPPRALDEAGEPVAAVERSPKTVALLAYLATAGPGEVRRRDPVTALLWPEQEHGHARHALRQLLTRLRHAVGAEFLRSDGEEALSLDPAASWADTVALDEALAGERLDEALELYTGPFLEGLHVPDTPSFELWADEARQRYLRLVIEAADRLARRARECGDRAAERAWLERGLELDPYSEPRSERLVHLLQDVGEHGAAMVERERLTRRLETDLGLAPMSEPLRASRPGPYPAVAERGKPTDRIDVAEEMLRGRHHLEGWSSRSLERALVHFSRAARGDPRAAGPVAGLALTYSVLGHLGHLAPRAAFSRAERTARQALEADSEAVDAHLALGLAAILYHRDSERALAHLTGARRAAPDHPLPYWALGLVDIALARYEQARHRLRRAHLLDPLSIPVSAGLAWAHIAAGDLPAGERHLSDILDLDPQSSQATWQLGIIRLLEENPTAAVQLFQRALHDSSLAPVILASLSYASAAAGRESESRHLLKHLHEGESLGRFVPHLAFATAHAGLDASDAARHALSRAIVEHDPFLPFLRSWPFTRRFHGDPWFQYILDALFLPVAEME